jgi:hypothetical protein
MIGYNFSILPTGILEEAAYKNPLLRGVQGLPAGRQGGYLRMHLE